MPPGVQRGLPTTNPYSQTGKAGQWIGGKWVPAAGASNDADQINYRRAEADSAGAQGKGYASTYTDAQGRAHSIGTPAKTYAPGTSAADPTGFDTKMSQFGRFMGTFGNGGGSGSTTMTGRGGLSGSDQPRVALDTGAIAAGDAAITGHAWEVVVIVTRIGPHCDPD